MTFPPILSLREQDALHDEWLAYRLAHVLPKLMQQRYERWLVDQAAAGHTFTGEQRWWLDRIAEQIGLNLSATMDDYQGGELRDRGGWIAAYRLFDAEFPAMLEDMNAALAL